MSSLVTRGRLHSWWLKAVVSTSVPVLLISGMGPALASEGLEWDTSIVYSVDVERGTLDLESDVRLTNVKPDEVTEEQVISYFFEGIALYVPKGVKDLRATRAGRELEIVLDPSAGAEVEGFDLATITFDPRLSYRQSIDLHIEYSLEADPPRTNTPFRVNPAYVSFGVYRWGDEGRTEIAIRLDPAFEFNVTGAGQVMTVTEDGAVYTLVDFGHDDLLFVQGRNDANLTSARVDLDAYDIEVRAWPDDPTWSEDVAAAAPAGLPHLQELVGLPWQPQDRLTIVESQEVTLAGYGGWYLAADQRIEIGEWVDPHLLLHELSHTWFHDGLFTERWIIEGLANAYGALAVAAAGLEPAPDVPDSAGPTELVGPLNGWVVPEPGSEGLRQYEEQGYRASWWLVSELVDEVGVEAMSTVLAAAARNEIAYAGAPGPELAPPADDWRRFLDLVQEIGGSVSAESLFETLVVGESLDERREARAHYAALLDRGWHAPFYVRDPMSGWRFGEAVDRIVEARAILEKANAVERAAEVLDVTAPVSLQVAFESAVSGLGEPDALADRQLDTANLVVDAKNAAGDARGMIALIGLLGAGVDARITEASRAFADDDLDGARQRATEALAALDGAEDRGRVRVLAGSVVVLLTGGGAFLLARRRRSGEDDGSDRRTS